MELTQNQFYGLERDRPHNLPSGSTYVEIDTSKFFYYNDDEMAVTITALSGTSAFRNVTDGLANVDAEQDAYRLAKTGFNETDPEELIDVVGNDAESTGGAKFDYTWADGSRGNVVFGGNNALSEIGIPSGALKVNLFDYLGAGDYAGWRAYLVNGDISAVSAASGKLSIQMGINTLASDKTNVFSIFPAGGSGTKFIWRLINTVDNPQGGSMYSYLSSRGDLPSGNQYGDAIVIDTQFDGIRTFAWTKYYSSTQVPIKLEGLSKSRPGQSVDHPGISYTISGPNWGTAIDDNGFLINLPGTFAGKSSEAPSSSSDDGTEGELRYDDSYVYRHDGTEWKRASISFVTF